MKLFEDCSKHKSLQCAEWMTLICALQFADFLRLCLSPRTTSRTISFSISNSFWYYCKSQIFVRYLIRTFVLLKKELNLKPYENFFLLWDPRFSTSFYFEAFESTKISSYEPVSRQKYENGYRTKICNFTVIFLWLLLFWTSRICMSNWKLCTIE